MVVRRHDAVGPDDDAATLELKGVSKQGLTARQALLDQIDGLKRQADAGAARASEYFHAAPSGMRDWGRDGSGRGVTVNESLLL